MKETLIDDTHKEETETRKIEDTHEETETRKIEDVMDDIKTVIEILKILKG